MSARRNRQADDVAAVALVVGLSAGAGVVDHSQRRRGVDDTLVGWLVGLISWLVG